MFNFLFRESESARISEKGIKQLEELSNIVADFSFEHSLNRYEND